MPSIRTAGGDQPMSVKRAAVAALCAALATLLMPWAASRAADPIKVGFSMALTGGVAPNGKQNLLALEIWRDDVNARGGLLGRPVELVYYDDQSNPNNVPGIYTNLLSVDVNRQFNYPRYFSMVPGGDEGTRAFSRGWFELAAAQSPRPKTVALIAADAE